MAQQITILGASARAAAFSAIAAGFEPHAIDLFADRDLAAACPAVRIKRYPHGFLAALANAPQSPWIYTGGLENYPRLIDRLAAIRPLWGNRGAGLRAVRDPSRLSEVAKQAGLSFPETHAASGRRKPPGTVAEQWLVKPSNSSGGLSIRFATDRDFIRSLRHSHLQRYIAGDSASAIYSAAVGRAQLLGATRQILGRDIGIEDRPFLYAGSLAPLLLPDDQLATLSDFGNLLAAEFSLIGLIGVDFVISDGTIWIVEVNPRYTASVEVLERVQRERFFAYHAAACASSSLPDRPTTPLSRYAGKRILYAPNDLIIPPELEKLTAHWNAAQSSSSIADLPTTGDKLLAGQPICTVLADGPSATLVEQSLLSQAQAINQLLTPDS